MSEKRISKIDFRINRADEIGILHDSRKDVRTLAKVANALIDKINELVNKINALDEQNSNNGK